MSPYNYQEEYNINPAWQRKILETKRLRTEPGRRQFTVLEKGDETSD